MTESAPTHDTLLSLVVVGHVDHGKSTLLGRLLFDIGALPEGKLEAVQRACERGAKPFEYAFLLDALRDERDQGITIDAARCFFHSAKRRYLVFDAPGHIEFLKNMVTGATRAEAALLVIDAREGVRENSRRHGYLLSMLGVSQVAVVINKMDLVGYDEAHYRAVVEEYRGFLAGVGVGDARFLPVSARDGENVARRSAAMPWHQGPTLLDTIDAFHAESPAWERPLRLPVQDVYRFTEAGDDRRIIAGRIESGRLCSGELLTFHPSGKQARVQSLEGFGGRDQPATEAQAGQCVGVTLDPQVYLKPGEIATKAGDPAPMSGNRLRVRLFWMGREPMVAGKAYKIKLATARAAAWLERITHVFDAAHLALDSGRAQVARHDVAEIIVQTQRPLACDAAADLPHTGRFVIVDNYEIVGGGLVLELLPPEQGVVERLITRRQREWEKSALTPGMRAGRYKHRSTFIVLASEDGERAQAIARSLEETLFEGGRFVYYLGLSNARLALDAGFSSDSDRDDYLRRLGELAHLFTDAGLILIATVPDLDDDELALLEALNRPGDLLLVRLGERRFSRREPDLRLDGASTTADAVAGIQALLTKHEVLVDYYL